MKAAVLRELNAPLTVEELVFPMVQAGQVLVKVKASSICGAQLREISGANGGDRYLPHLLGHEGSGIVIRAGDGVTHVKEGDHVVMHWRKGVGVDSPFPLYSSDGGNVGGGLVTTFNEYAVVSGNRLTTIREDIPFDVATLLGCAVTTAFGLVSNEAQLKIGQSITVAGCGGVGMNVIQAAAVAGAYPIIAIDIDKGKLEGVAVFGASHIIDAELNDSDMIGEIKDATRKGVDVFVDCTGDPDIINIGYNAISPGGKVILVGQPRHNEDLVIKNFHKHYCGKTMMDSQGGLTNPTIDIPRYLEMYRQGAIKLSELITHRFPLEKINDAIAVVKSGEAIKCILEMP